MAARSPEEAVALWHGHDDAMYVAGGTDLLPNVKHRIFRPRHVVGLAGALPSGWEERDDEIVIGAGMTLTALSTLDALAPLAAAAGVVAGPQIRNMGTLGGNVLLDTRCLFYNQTEFWRESLGYCLKAEGTWCHVVGGPKTCVATQSSDTVPALMALGASIRVLGPHGSRDLLLTDLFQFNGMDHLKVTQGELITHVIVPPRRFPRATRSSAPGGHRPPAVRGHRRDLRGARPGLRLGRLEIVIGAVNPQPKPVAGLAKLRGRPLSDETIDEISALTVKRTRPQASAHGEPAWRRQMAGVFVRRALRALRENTPVPVEV